LTISAPILLGREADFVGDELALEVHLAVGRLVLQEGLQSVFLTEALFAGGLRSCAHVVDLDCPLPRDEYIKKGSFESLRALSG